MCLNKITALNFIRNNIYKLLSILMVSLALLGCISSPEINNADIYSKENNLLTLPFNASYFIKNTNDIIQVDEVEKLKNDYLNKLFSVWNDLPPPLPQDIFWGLNVNTGFDETKRPLNNFTFLREEMNTGNYPSLNAKAIMVKSANVRLFPTIKPRYSVVDGHPFDRWQNSFIFAFTPVRILHESKNKEWILIESAFVSGWVKQEEVALINKEDMRQLLNTKDFVIPNTDYVPLYDHKGSFIEYARIGMLLPKVKGEEELKDTKEVYVFKRDSNGMAYKQQISVDNFYEFPLPLNEFRVASHINLLLGENYGWGGMYGNRDCSAFMRDIFMNYGIFLPRNSLAQIRSTKSIEIPKELTNQVDKVEFIKSHAIPFKTLLWFKGHIMLFIGMHNDLPVVAHDVWAVKSNGRVEILGGVSITTLKPGSKELLKEENVGGTKSALLDRVEFLGYIPNLN